MIIHNFPQFLSKYASQPEVSISTDDLIVWPCGTYCDLNDYYYRGEYDHMSDDFIVLAHGSVAWVDFCIKEGLR